MEQRSMGLTIGHFILHWRP